ncbi:hypothetical protein LY76DRAFT_304542 [Colletotrichum caudatum]|nr:hypothetical protein LY76DRAFT_304542 [Colletotrichum caudatum]
MCSWPGMPFGARLACLTGAFTAKSKGRNSVPDPTRRPSNAHHRGQSRHSVVDHLRIPTYLPTYLLPTEVHVLRTCRQTIRTLTGVEGSGGTAAAELLSACPSISKAVAFFFALTAHVSIMFRLPACLPWKAPRRLAPSYDPGPAKLASRDCDLRCRLRPVHTQ